MTDLAAIERIDIDADTPLEKVCAAMDMLAYIKQWVKAQDERIEAAITDYILKNGPFEIGDVRHYVGARKVTKCRDPGAALQALLEQYGHEHVGKHFLGSQPFKYGTIREEAGQEMFDRLFIVDEVLDHKTGAAKKVLQHADKRLIGRGAAEAKST